MPQALKTMNAVVLAGGLSSRMEGMSKPLAQLGQRPLIEHVIQRVEPQVARTHISINGEAEQFQPFGHNLVFDENQPPRGPLEGVLSAMRFIRKENDNCRWLLVVTADSPFLPLDLAAQLKFAAESRNAQVAYISYGKDKHYLCSLWATELEEQISAYLNQAEGYSVRGLLKQLNAMEYEFKAETQNPFFNINTPTDLRKAQTLFDT